MPDQPYYTNPFDPDDDPTDPFAPYPDAVREIAAPAAEWAHFDPRPPDVTPCTTCGTDLWLVYYADATCRDCGSEWCYATPDGERVHGAHVEDPGATPYNTRLGRDPDATHLLCGHCADELRYGSPETMILAGYTLCYWEDAGVVYDIGAATRDFDSFCWPPDDAPAGLRDAMYAYLAGEIGTETLAERVGADPDDPSRPARR